MNLTQYSDKKVVVTRRLAEPNKHGHLAEEIEGRVVAANEVGLLLKPTGKVLTTLIREDEIEDVVIAPTVLRTFKSKFLREVTLDSVRQHLLEKHGFRLSEINEMNERQAMEVHAETDHSDLIHHHNEGQAEV